MTVERLVEQADGEYLATTRSAIIDRFFRDRTVVGDTDLPAGSLSLRFHTTEPARGDLYRMSGQNYRVETSVPVQPFFMGRVATLVPFTRPITLAG